MHATLRARDDQPRPAQHGQLVRDRRARVLRLRGAQGPRGTRAAGEQLEQRAPGGARQRAPDTVRGACHVT